MNSSSTSHFPRHFHSIFIYSVASIDLVNALGSIFDLELSPTFPFNHPTIDDMAFEIFNMKAAMTVSENIILPNMVFIDSGGFKSGGIFVESITAALPGYASRVPFDRWDPDKRFSSIDNESFSSFTRFGGFVHDLYDFDGSLFRLSRKEALVLDPQHRKLLAAVLQTAGQHSPCTSVTVGIARLEDDWPVLLSTHAHILNGNGLVSTARAASAAAGRISYTFDFKGACLSIDTACSSSLVALKVLMDDLMTTSNIHGFSGGVSLPLSLRTSMMLAASMMLAPDGRCKTLDSTSDGYGRSEACSILKCIKHQDEDEGESLVPQNVQAWVEASVVNQDGASSGLTAPHGPSQEMAIRDALLTSDIMSSQISIHGLHGTGTPLGDPIEYSAVARIQGAGTHILSLSASKSRFGHAETASGIVGFLQQIRSITQHESAEFMNLRHMNGHIVRDLKGRKPLLLVPRQRRPLVLPGTDCARSSISAFAFQGSNAVTIIRDHTTREFFVPNSQKVRLHGVQCMPFPLGHPLLTGNGSRDRGNLTYHCSAHHPNLDLMDHQVSSTPLMPAAAFLDLSMSTATSLAPSNHTVVLINNAFLRPCILKQDRVDLRISISLSQSIIKVTRHSEEEEMMLYQSTCAVATDRYVNT